MNETITQMDKDNLPEDAIAIIGMAGRFPGAADVREFWRNLRAGEESVKFFSRDELLANGVPAAVADDPAYVNANAVLDGIEQFDADFFGIPPREAEVMDPQHRLFLECASAALEHAGYDADQYTGSIGVFAGTGLSSYLLHHLARRQDIVNSAGHLQLLLGNNKDYLPLRVSYKLNLKGPSVNVNTACSTSLVAIHMACQNLLGQQCDMALAGGIGIQVPQDQGYWYSPNGISSPDGHCRAFDLDAQGTVNGNGGGVVVLKRAADALADGDTIHALILASAVNNDGAAKVGFTAPSVEGQANVIAEALALAGVDAASIGYVEAHGTGTSLGDPIEIAALTQAFRAYTGQTGFCALGSVKTNIGHLDEGAGVAGLIKTVLALRHREIPPSLHFHRPNPQIDFANSPFQVQTRLTPWERRGGPRRAGVSSFGLGGTNAHLVLQEAPPQPAGGPSRPWQLLLLSAKTPTALEAAAANLAAHLRDHPGANLADVAYTLQVGRKAYAYRKAVVCQTVEDALSGLQAAVSAPAVGEKPPELAFLFPGQGSQYPNMGLGLYQTEPVFREHLDRCCDGLRPHLGLDLREILYPKLAQAEQAAQTLQQTAFAQPALFAVEYALAQLWIGLGITPKKMLGHSIGEYVAACLAGVFSLQDALGLVAARGRLMQQMPTGGMLAVELSEDALQPWLGAGLELAAVNAPSLCVIAGPPAALGALQDRLAGQGIGCQPLRTSHAFHSEAMDAMLAPFLEQVWQIRLSAPKIPYLSNLTGDWITAAEATDPVYWQQHLRHTVRFADGMARLLQQPETVLLEVGPGRSLGGLARRHPASRQGQTIAQSLRHPHDPGDDAQNLLDATGQLWVTGVCRRFDGFHAEEHRLRVELPTYPFQRKRYWINPPAETAAPPPKPARPKIDDWFYAPVWNQREPRPQPNPPPPGAHWLVFADASDAASHLLEWLHALGMCVSAVYAGRAFTQTDADGYTLNPQNPDDYTALFAALDATSHLPETIVHAWNLAPARSDDWEQAQYLGLYSLVFLAQAAGRQNLPSVRLSVLSNHMQRIGGEAQSPLQASLLGAVRVIPKEYPQIQCHSIDLALPEDENLWLEHLLAELLGDCSETAIALRGNEVWVQDFKPLPLAAATPRRLREHGTYLLTGGLGSMGLAFARHLAQEARAKLVLLGRTGLPPEAEWDAYCRDGLQTVASTCFDLAAATSQIQAYETEAKASAGLRDIDAEPRLRQLLRAFCSHWILRYFAECGVELKTGRFVSEAALREKLKIQPKFNKFLAFLLRALAEDGLIRQDAEGIEILDLQGLGEFAATRQALLGEFGEFHGLVRFVEHCASQYRPALSGEIPSISVLYPDGTPALMDECGKTNPRYSGDQLYLAALAKLAADLARRADGKPLKILEVGGGVGGLTMHLVPALRGYPVEYHFTDLGGSMLRRAQRQAEAEGLDFMRFASFDISQDPTAQGFEAHSFDLVVGYNVVHATPDIAQALGHLRLLLAERGLLALVETTRLRRWDEMVWGLTEGWWHFSDENLRQTSPLIAPDDWERLLRGQAFTAAVYPQDPSARLAADTALVLGQCEPSLPAAQLREAITTIRECRAAGGEVLALQADVADLGQLRAALEQARQQFGPLHGVIHTAGVLGQGAIHAKTVAQMRAVLAPKIAGTLNLAQALQEQASEPDFLLLCSSLASVAPTFGQVDYCAANAFLDAYANAHAGRGKTDVIAVDWGFWQALGMIGQANLPAEWKQKIADEIDAQGWAGAGVDVFDRILASCDAPQVLVSPGKLEQMLQGAFSLDAKPVHPWFDGHRDLGDGISAYVCTLSPRRDWVLGEHRPLGQAVFPGTAYLELAYAAAQAQRPGQPVELGEVYFLHPLTVADDATGEIRILLAARGAGFEFTVISRVAEDSWLEHARGEIAYLDGAAPVAPRLDGLAAACMLDDITIAADSGHPFARRVSGFTPHWRCLQRVQVGEAEALATLALAPEFAAETASLPLHPGLLDMATGFMAMLDGFEAGAPFGYRRLRIWRPLTPLLHSHARRNAIVSDNERSYDLRLFDPADRLLLEAEGYHLREYPPVMPDSATPPENFCVEIDEPGNLGSLALRPAPRRTPGPGEVEIEVKAAGLNFIEVLYALGLLPEPPGVDRMRFGLECAGIVSAVGAGVEGFAPGDAVYGLVQRCFSRYALAPAYALAKKPDFLSFADAATIPAAYATAYDSLLTRGRMRRGEKVLIHAAAGGVGLAAVNIAAWRGAEIHATAGSAEKREYLKSLGIEHVSDSRSLEFVAQTLAATGGKGVDLVLNSLGGEFIPASLSLLARYGRFLELGKRDIFRDTPLGMAPFEKHLSFIAIDVGIDLPEFGAVWRQVAGAVRRQNLKPLPYCEFPLSQLQQAFEFMAQAKHIGKVIINIGDSGPTLAKPQTVPRGRPLDAILKPWRPTAAPSVPALPKESEHARPSLKTAYRAASGPDETAILAIWEELLGVSGIGVDDNFFELRGDSLLAAQVTSRLYQAFQVKLPLSSVFEHPTVTGLAAKVAQIRQSARDLEAVPLAALTDGEVEHEL